MQLKIYFVRSWSALLLAASACLTSRAATNVVTNINDSGPGSLRAAISNANLSVNVPDVIHFNIAGAGPHTITPVTPLPTITDPVTVDGYTQAGSSSNSLAQGDNAVLQIVVVDKLLIDTSNSTVRGLAVRQIQLGDAPGSKGGNLIEGNFIGLDATGSNSLGSTGSGVFVQTPTNRIGGSTPGARNVIAGHGTTGMEIFEAFASGNVVQGNYIGTDRNGTKAIPNTDRALVVNMNAFGNTIGGILPGAGNLISGNLNRGITLDGSSNRIQGNFIGTDVTGLNPLGNARSGVEIGGPANIVGGTASGAGNVIAFNGVDGGGFTTNGVDVKPGATDYAVLGNSIFDNAGLGIDVNANGLVTAGFPVLTLASNANGTTVIKGTHTPSTTFRLELFTNPSPDPSGYGEGRTLLVSSNVTTDGSGVFTLNWPAPVPPGLFLTATADGATEFSQDRLVVAAGGPNSWTNNLGGKWEGAPNWSLNVAPYIGHSFILITNPLSKTVSNDTVTANAFPSTLTISNLIISGSGGATNTLLLTQGGTQTPLTILSNCAINSGGALTIQNGALHVNGPFGTGLGIDGSTALAGGELAVTNPGTQLLIGKNGRGALSVLNGKVLANYSIVGANDGSDGTWHIAGGTNIIAGGAFDIADSLTATGTVWMTGGRLQVPNAYIGLFGNGRLIVSNGIVECAGTGLVASQPGSQGSFVAAGGTSIFGDMLVGENSSATGSVLVAGSGQVQVNGPLNNGGSVTVSGGELNVLGQVTSEVSGNSIQVTGGRFVATNDSAFLTSVTVSNGTFLARDVFLGNQKAGTFTVAGGTVSLPGSFNGFSVGVNGGTGTVSQTGGAIILTNTDLNVGGLFSPATGLVTISNGAASAVNVFVGGQGGGTGVVTVASGALTSSNLFIGSSSSQNRLTASNGASLFTGGHSFLGLDTGANSNSASLGGPGTQWLLSSNLYVGSGGASNRLAVGKGATLLVAGHGLIGQNSGANFNSAVVTDLGTGWLLGSNLYVGSNGAWSSLVLSNGARLADSQAFLGFDVFSISNLALVTGSGSVWSNANNLIIGLNGAQNQLVIANGGLVWDNGAELGSSTSSGNVAVVTDPGSVWNNAATLNIGRSGRGNRLIVTNGGMVLNDISYFATSTSSTGNVAVVSGSGSVWRTTSSMLLGESGWGNGLVVSNGGAVFDQDSYLGFSSSGTSSNNVAVVTGSGSVWSNALFLGVGYFGPRNQLAVSNGGAVFTRQALLGTFPTSTNNRIEINGGSLTASDILGNGLLDIRRGTNVLNAGLIKADQLLVTNAQGLFEFNGGTLSSRKSKVSNGTLFRIGDGLKPATFILEGNGVHEFTGTLTVSSNGTLTGNGTIGGPLMVSSGGKIVPGVPGGGIGTMVVSNSPTVQGTLVMEISKNVSALTNDEIQVLAPLTYGGSLIVSNLGPTAPAGGDRYKLFTASSYAESFTSVVLPVLNPGLVWTNKLLVDGSIEVLGPASPEIGSIVVSGTNVVISGSGGPTNGSYFVLTSTNIALPLTNWTMVLTNQFNATGNFIFTNAIIPTVPSRFYAVQVQ